MAPGGMLPVLRRHGFFVRSLDRWNFILPVVGLVFDPVALLQDQFVKIRLEVVLRPCRMNGECRLEPRVVGDINAMLVTGCSQAGRGRDAAADGNMVVCPPGAGFVPP